ncbi:DUF4062 domain-containing protein [Gammaproteobacteria bacterium]
MSDIVLSREIRVFLSSTFKDMEAERNYLLQHVFPEVRERCAERRAGFSEIDLRWGVTEAAAKNGQTVAICLAEIDRCRDYPPFFIGFLGERYGWVPRPADLASYWADQPESPYRKSIEQALAQGISVTELEMRFGVLQRPDMCEYAYFFLRAPELTNQLYADAGQPARSDFYDSSSGKLEELKQALHESGRLDMDGYTSVKEFGERVKEILLKEIDSRFPAEEARDVFAIRTRSHALFAQSRRQSYVPLEAMREQMRASLQAHLDGERRGPILLTGVSGLGKSAFLADLAQWLPGSLNVWVVDHHIGADGLRSLEAWRDGILDQMGKIITDPQSLPEDDKGKWEALPIWLYKAYSKDPEGQRKPIILLLDALDQLYDSVAALTRLGEAFWPQGVVLVASILSEHAQSAPLWNRLELPVPSEGEQRQIVEAFTTTYRKTLEPSLVDRLLHLLVKAPQAQIPLFLRMVLEDLRVHGKHDTLANRLDTLLGQPDASALFAFLLGEWDRDYGDAAHPDIASRLAAFLAASRQGLAVQELADLLAAESDPIAIDSNRPRLPAPAWSALLAVLRPYLLRNTGLDSLMHAALMRGSLPQRLASETRNALLAYFQGDTPRALAERVYQRLQILDENKPGMLRRLFRMLARFIGVVPTFQKNVERDITNEFTDPRHLVSLHAEDDKLLRRALLHLGADKRIVTTEVHHIIEAWGDSQIAWDDFPGVNEAFFWLNMMAFNKLSECMAKGMLAWRRKHLPYGHHITASSLYNLANIFAEQGSSEQDQVKLEVAEKMFEESLQMFETNKKKLPDLLPGHANTNIASTARVLNSLSGLHVKLGNLDIQKGRQLEGLHRFGAAKRLLEKALQLCQQQQKIDIAGYLDISLYLNNLAGLYQMQSRQQDQFTAKVNLKNAEQLFRQSLEIRHEYLPRNHLDIATSYNNLAQLYQEEGFICMERDEQYYGEYDPQQLFNKALLIFRQSLPPTHPTIAIMLSNLASFYFARGRHEEAEQLYKETLHIRRHILPKRHPDIVRTIQQLASVRRVIAKRK